MKIVLTFLLGLASAAWAGDAALLDQPALAARLRAAGSSGSGAAEQQLRGAAQDPSFVRLLAWEELLRGVNAQGWNAFLGEEESRTFLQDLFEQPDWVGDLLCSGPTKDTVGALRILRRIWRSDPGCVTNLADRALATAAALQWSGEADLDKPLARYRMFRDAQRAGELNPIYDTLVAWEKRYLVAGGWDDASMDWLRENVKLPVADYGGACWQAPYRGFSAFGDTVQGPLYYMPWDDQMCRAENARKHGGVCGSLSTYGATAARANGIPATTMGEPGHCAYAVRVAPGQWKPAYSLSWKRGVHISFYAPSWSHLVLFDDVFGDRTNLLRALPLLWEARLYREQDPARALVAYGLAAAAQPRNYEVWKESLEWMVAGKRLTTDGWLALTARLLAAFRDYPDIAWSLMQIYADQAVLPALDTNGKINFYGTFHTAMRDHLGPDRWDFEALLDRQIRTFEKDRDAQLRFYRAVLLCHATSPHYLAPTLAWGQQHFGEKPADARVFAAMVADCLKRKGGEMDKGALRSALASALLASAKNDDLAAFRSLATLAGEQGKPPHGQPKFEPFPGELLSAEGLLKTSSTCAHDTPWFHAAVPGPGPGFFHTDRETHPWAVVMLPRLGRLSGIVIVNRPDANDGRQVPLVVSISEDGKDWSEVFRAETPSAVWRIPLGGNGNRARYIKAERPEGRQEYFHLVNILAYGERLQ